MMRNAKWALGSGLQLLGSECRDGRWTVSAVGQGSARCPGCDVRSTRRHGWQVRHLQDLPAQGAPVTLRVSLARWRCQNQRRERQTRRGKVIPRVTPKTEVLRIAVPQGSKFKGYEPYQVQDLVIKGR